jgi:hypothetical protein
MSLRCLLLWHHWIARSAKSVTWWNYSSTGEKLYPTRNTTEVLYGCTRCSSVKVRRLDGSWSLAEVRPARAVEDMRAELERLP